MKAVTKERVFATLEHIQVIRSNVPKWVTRNNCTKPYNKLTRPKKCCNFLSPEQEATSQSKYLLHRQLKKKDEEQQHTFKLGFLMHVRPVVRNPVTPTFFSLKTL